MRTSNLIVFIVLIIVFIILLVQLINFYCICFCSLVLPFVIYGTMSSFTISSPFLGDK